MEIPGSLSKCGKLRVLNVSKNRVGRVFEDERTSVFPLRFCSAAEVSQMISCFYSGGGFSVAARFAAYRRNIEHPWI